MNLTALLVKRAKKTKLQGSKSKQKPSCVHCAWPGFVAHSLSHDTIGCSDTCTRLQSPYRKHKRFSKHADSEVVRKCIMQCKHAKNCCLKLGNASLASLSLKQQATFWSFNQASLLSLFQLMTARLGMQAARTQSQTYIALQCVAFHR